MSSSDYANLPKGEDPSKFNQVEPTKGDVKADKGKGIIGRNASIEKKSGLLDTKSTMSFHISEINDQTLVKAKESKKPIDLKEISARKAGDEKGQVSRLCIGTIKELNKPIETHHRDVEVAPKKKLRPPQDYMRALVEEQQQMEFEKKNEQQMDVEKQWKREPTGWAKSLLDNNSAVLDIPLIKTLDNEDLSRNEKLLKEIIKSDKKNPLPTVALGAVYFYSAQNLYNEISMEKNTQNKNANLRKTSLNYYKKAKKELRIALKLEPQKQETKDLVKKEITDLLGKVKDVLQPSIKGTRFLPKKTVNKPHHPHEEVASKRNSSLDQPTGPNQDQDVAKESLEPLSDILRDGLKDEDQMALEKQHIRELTGWAKKLLANNEAVIDIPLIKTLDNKDLSRNEKLLKKIIKSDEKDPVARLALGAVHFYLAQNLQNKISTKNMPLKNAYLRKTSLNHYKKAEEEITKALTFETKNQVAKELIKQEAEKLLGGSSF